MLPHVPLPVGAAFLIRFKLLMMVCSCACSVSGDVIDRACGAVPECVSVLVLAEQQQ